MHYTLELRATTQKVSLYISTFSHNCETRESLDGSSILTDMMLNDVTYRRFGR